MFIKKKNHSVELMRSTFEKVMSSIHGIKNIGHINVISSMVDLFEKKYGNVNETIKLRSELNRKLIDFNI